METGDDFIILNFSLTTTYSSITTTKGFRSALLRGRGGINVVIRRSSSDTPELQLEGQSLKITTNRIPDSGATITICQAKAETGTGTLEVVLTI